ncbi:tripartite tricarboxylate transporter substrate binding protein [Ramlibacter sp. AN1015]|uniref:Bug family tripartite tricarboxylate transporter substrate binding protein n=1 Tax=Ramlibacter sp. AN1015 TaxID=3133428 RepID=UPI0030C10A88
MFRSAIRSVVAISLGALMTTLAAAQDYPDKPVRFVLPFPPGGSADAVTRELAERLQAKGNGTFLIENKPGAGGNLATGYVVKSPNDGYTILVGVTGAMVINPELYPNLGYRPETDLTGISMLAQAPVAIVASRESGLTSIKELVQRAKAKPGELSYATNGVGTSHHLAGELFKQKAGIFMLNIPYTGTPGALQDIAGGRVQVGFLDLTASLPLINSGRIVALATTGSKRPSALPNVPTVAEAGYPDYEAMTWISLVAPKGMKREQIDKLNGMINAVLAEESFKKSTAAKGMEAVGSTPDALQSFVTTEAEKWRGVIRGAGIRIN